MKKMEKMEKCAGDMSVEKPGEFQGAGCSSPDDGQYPQTECLKSDLIGQSSKGEHHNKYTDTNYDGTGEKNKGKRPNIDHICNLALSPGFIQDFDAKHGPFS
jgi:hypothetical protein